MALRIQSEDSQSLTLLNGSSPWAFAFYLLLATAAYLAFTSLVAYDRLSCRDGRCVAEHGTGFNRPTIARFDKQAIQSPEVAQDAGSRNTITYYLTFRVAGYGQVTIRPASWSALEVANQHLLALQAYLAGDTSELEIAADNRLHVLLAMTPFGVVLLTLMVLALSPQRAIFDRRSRTVTVERRWLGGYVTRRVIPLEAVQAVEQSSHKEQQTLTLDIGDGRIKLGTGADKAKSEAVCARLRDWLAESPKVSG